MKKNKILYLNNAPASILAGGEKHLLSIAKAAKNTSYQVSVVCTPESKLQKELEKANIEAIPMNLNSFNLVSTIISLKRLFQKKKIDILHTHGFLTNNLGRIAGRLAKTPIIISTVHCEPDSTLSFSPGLLSRIRQFLRNRIDNFTSRYCNATIAVSKSVKEKLLRQGVSSSKIKVIHNGVSVKHAQLKAVQEKSPISGLEKNERIVGTVGRLEPVKGIEYLIQAAPLIKEQVAKVKFVIVGDGSLKTKLHELTNQLDLDQDVIFAGYQPNTASLVNQFEIFVLPSLSEGGSNLALSEALALRKPAVATKVGGNPEVVIDRETGILVPPKDAKSLANAIITLLKDKPLCQQLGAEGKRLVSKEFTVEKMTKQTLKLYDKLIKTQSK